MVLIEPRNKCQCLYVEQLKPMLSCGCWYLCRSFPFLPVAACCPAHALYTLLSHHTLLRYPEPTYVSSFGRAVTGCWSPPILHSAPHRHSQVGRAGQSRLFSYSHQPTVRVWCATLGPLLGRINSEACFLCCFPESPSVDCQPDSPLKTNSWLPFFFPALFRFLLLKHDISIPICSSKSVSDGNLNCKRFFFFTQMSF